MLRIGWTRWTSTALFGAALALAGCAEDGAQGPQGERGPQGEQGEQGEQGPAGDVGPQGPAGDVGPQGPAGDVGPQGEQGEQGEKGDKGDKGEQGEQGEQGEPGEGYFARAPNGVVGQVTAGGGHLVTSGHVYFVPAADVAALPATTIAVDSTNDEPLEDLIALNGATYPMAMVGEDGRYRLETLADGRWFVVYVPDVDDTMHLPGGDLCRNALASTDMRGGRFDIRISDAIPADAEYVGSGTCVTCHGKKHINGTMHRIGIWSPYQHGPLQDFEPRFGEMYQALEGKFTETGTTVYFHGYDGTRGFDKYRTSEADPGTNVSFKVTVRERDGVYEMVMVNVKDPTDPKSPMVLPVDIVYGGGVLKQRYMTKVENASGFYHAMLPLQFQHEGQEASLYGRTSKVWRDYNAYKYYDETNMKLLGPPGASNSFEKNCISCHANGVRVTGSDATTWTADLQSDWYWGDFDYDADGTADEVNLGCENCHGPGSAHWESTGQGRHIVALGRITPEREAMVCGQCHSRPKGFTNTDSPVDAEGNMMIAGESREQFLAEHATKQLDGAASDYWDDPDKHSKSHHQQYTDFIRSSMYKNDTTLMTCSDCHDPHRVTENPRQLRADPTDNAESCGSCHDAQTDNLAGHIDTALGMPVGNTMANATCTSCHMPKTAKTGAGKPGIKIGAVQFWQNDISSHLFVSPDKAISKADGTGAPTGYTNACGTCHTSL